jgi:hypothetical protein
MPELITDNSNVTSVWSAYGHRFMSDGGEGTESCLTCGAIYDLMAYADDPSQGIYIGGDGAEPMACTGDTSMVHGDPSEQIHGLECEDGCAHCQHQCNCRICC